MKIYNHPAESELEQLLARATEGPDGVIRERVEGILKRVRTEGDAAIADLTKAIDGVDLDAVGMEVTPQELAEAGESVPEELKAAVAVAKTNIEAFHAAQRHREVRVETVPGVECWQRAVPIKRVGLYVPAGSAPLFSTVLMLALPAKIAGVGEIVLCSPAGKDGRVAPEILYAAQVCGVDKIYKLGGAVAVGAMAYGTERIAKVDKIFGPGNQYVTTAKQLVSLFDVAIDMPAGPSEVLVLADKSADPAFTASDLLSQAEHGPDSQAILITDSFDFALAVQSEVLAQIKKLSRAEIAEKAVEKSRIIVVESPERMIELSNRYAPEHLIISMRDAEEVARRIEAAGSIFIGNYTPESAGDYASGTNHTLPTSGWARSYSGVNLDSFTKKITYQHISPEGLKTLGPVIETMAAGEGLDAHKNAVTIRLASLKNE